MAEKTFNIDFAVPYAGTGHLPASSFPSIVNRNGITYIIYINGADSRVKIGRWDGATFTSAYLDPVADWTVPDDNHYLPTLGMDEDGYLHATAHMHSYPNATNDASLPTRYKSKQCMYFKSDSPYNISSFTFLGEDDTYAPKAHDFTCVRFVNDNFNKLYIVWRTGVFDAYAKGLRGLSLQVYEKDTGTWVERGVVPNIGGAYEKVFMWQNGGCSINYEPTTYVYQAFYSRLYFDSQNRMHFATEVGSNETVEPDTILYCRSDDGGITWKKADGTVLILPVQVGDGGGAVGSSDGSVGDLLATSGVITRQACWMCIDENDNPIVTYYRDGNAVFRRWTGNEWTPEANHLAQHAGGTIPFFYKGKLVLTNSFSWGSHIRETDDMVTLDQQFTMDESVTAIDRDYANRSKLFYGASVNDPTNVEYGSFYITTGVSAFAGQDQLLPSGTTSTSLDGSASISEGGTISTYLWEQVSGNNATITGGDTAQPTITNMAGGTYAFRLTVTDSLGVIDNSNVNITIDTLSEYSSAKTLLL